MKTEQIITLTPPINGVQYGYNSDEIKEGDWCCLISKTKGFPDKIFKQDAESIRLHNFVENIHKVILSTNPKDTRFPYLVMPSKEQEYIKKLAQKVFDEHKGPASENEANYLNGRYNGIIEGFNANPAKYTQKQMIEFAKFWHDAIITNLSSAKDIITSDEDCFNKYIQSLQPTAKAVRVEREENNCDGCKAGIPVDEYNYHRMGKGIYPDFMICQKDKYNKIKVEQSTEYSQGIVKALEVIY